MLLWHHFLPQTFLYFLFRDSIICFFQVYEYCMYFYMLFSLFFHELSLYKSSTSGLLFKHKSELFIWEFHLPSQFWYLQFSRRFSYHRMGALFPDNLHISVHFISPYKWKSSRSLATSPVELSGFQFFS